MYDFFTVQRLAKIRQQELIAQAHQHGLQKARDHRPKRRLLPYQILSTLVMLARLD